MKYFHTKNPRHWIQDYDFDECNKTVIGLPCQYEACLHSNSGLYCIWVGVHFNRQLVHIYVEYNCGGEVAQETIDVSYVDVEEKHDFMIELDALVDEYAGRYLEA